MELKRSITLTGAIMINLGAIIGAGIFVIIGIAAYRAGPGVIISIVLSGIIAILTGLSFSEIARHVAKEGGAYEYAKDTLSPSAGFVAGWMWTSGNIIAIAAVATSFGSYFDVLFNINVNPFFIAVICILAFMTLNILGIKNSTKTITGLVILNVLVLLVFIFSGITRFNSNNYINFMPHGISGIITGTALIFFAFTGFSRVTTVSDEVVNPEKTIPLAIIVSIIISSILYILIAVVLIGLKPYYAYQGSTSPLSLAVSSLHNRYIDIIVSIGGVTSTAGVTLTGILGTSRVLFAMGRDKELPEKLSYIDRFSTPVFAIILSSILGIIFLIFVSFGTIVEASNSSVLISYIIINVAAGFLYLKLRKRETKRLAGRPFFIIIPALGIATILLIISHINIGSLEITGVILLICIIYYIIRRIALNIEGRRVPRHSDVRLFGKSRSRTN
ncbi:APC family permease [Picrophilus oshimae]|uniref:Amino acid/polyamine/organocation transporter, APC superfamily n=1 Tax=Picrophilus torridus (strain ATCC 700027 / DSM 9790 / JCM 10055 / NBRC 100828 / KAW 2/3) TaxID=1122961 RepID=A0A8G2L787_PICTO|nr:amino acid permease [Picrophilus oshimae]SMD30837.1 amino acid/polyamine/organocation transporter, APC superfamily [Picrophilus oshimae DSM 9789]